MVPINKELKVDIQIEQGLAFTSEGKKAAMKDLMGILERFAANGMMTPQAVKVALEKMLEAYSFGATSEFIEAMDGVEDQGQFTENQIQEIKIAVAEVISDLQGGQNATATQPSA